MNFTQEEKNDLIAQITEKINNGNNLLIMVSSIDDEQNDADTLLVAFGKWSRHSIDAVFGESFDDLMSKVNEQLN